MLTITFQLFNKLQKQHWSGQAMAIGQARNSVLQPKHFSYSTDAAESMPLFRDYLTGFKKRKQERRETAAKKFDKRFKQEKNRIRLEVCI